MVASLGFRGEALASIASVAKVESDHENKRFDQRFPLPHRGRRGTGTGGGRCAGRYDLYRQRSVLQYTGTPEVFKDAGDRRIPCGRFSRKIALSHPEISIRFINNNQSRLHTSGNHNLKDIIYAVFGREITANLIEVDAGADPIRVGGFIGKPLIARGNRTYENYFINGRYIKSSIIGKAIEDAYKPFMMQHKYPFTMLQFTIDPSYIDVNVHPAKMEIRFRDGEQIYRTVYHTIAMALANRELIPAVSLENEKNAEKS